MKKTLTVIFLFVVLTSFRFALAKTEDNGDRQNFRDQRVEKPANMKLEREIWITQRKDALEKFKAEKDELRLKFKEKFTEERCAKIQEKMKERIAHFDEKDGKHLKVYTNLLNRINKFIAKFDAAGLDTTVIKGHVAELQVKIDKFKEDFAAYRAKLAETKNFTCGHSEGEFKGTLLEAKTLLKTVHTDAAEIRKYVRTVILVDIKALKAQMPKDDDQDETDGSVSEQN